MTPADVMIVGRRDIARVMSPADWLEAAEQAFLAVAEGRAHVPPPLHLPVERGAFHAKGATIRLERHYAAVKVNGNFPGNPAELGLPTVQGTIVLADASNGMLLAILDSIEVTLRRTAAATALAAKLLAPRAETLLVCGCGEQGRAHVEALRDVLPIRRIMVWDQDDGAADALAETAGATAVRDIAEAAPAADVIACCTSARKPFLRSGMVTSGAFVAAVGADNADKSEVAPELMAAARVITDSTQQCAGFGDLHHAIAAALMTEADVHAELAEIVAGTAGHCLPEEIVVFDSTGTAVQDVAAAAMIHGRCAGLGYRPERGNAWPR